MATHYQPWETATEFGVHYVFDKVSDGITMHAHAIRSTYHSVRCLKGACAVYGDGVDVIVRAGETFDDFYSYRMHEIAALEDGTEIINVFMHDDPDLRKATKDGPSGSYIAPMLGRGYYT